MGMQKSLENVNAVGGKHLLGTKKRKLKKLPPKEQFLSAIIPTVCNSIDNGREPRSLPRWEESSANLKREKTAKKSTKIEANELTVEIHDPCAHCRCIKSPQTFSQNETNSRAISLTCKTREVNNALDSPNRQTSESAVSYNQNVCINARSCMITSRSS
jgi:hypothetical protein